MAITDAFGVACKYLGIGADVYWANDRTKYTDDTTPPPKTETKATPKQVEMLKKAYTGENLTKLLTVNGIDKIEDLSLKKASEIIAKITKKAEEKKNG